MKALTLYRPWAWSIIHGPKRIENRPWKPHASIIGQQFFIHAGSKWDAEGAAYIEKVIGRALPPEAANMGIVGRVRCTGFLDKSRGLTDLAPPGQEPWFFGPYGWLLDEVIRHRPSALQGRPQSLAGARRRPGDPRGGAVVIRRLICKWLGKHRWRLVDAEPATTFLCCARCGKWARYPL